MKLSSVAVALFGLTSSVEGFPPSNPSVSNPTQLSMSLDKYGDELKETAAKLTRPGFGLLACNESTGTVGARLESICVENIEENRAEWRSLLFTAEGLGNHLSGVILFEETLYQTNPSGEKMVGILNGQGIKVDTGIKPLCGADGKKIGARCEETKK